ncbi:DUF1176 domain-containing protein [Haemophilus sputorum]|uniref:DUF1176 domain-containing protein n=1 Tax=Haemophilus sputorum TaxID=1078480 RepID=A0ABX9HQG6_9PAST|nr:DUF1176 domain-containing protein [Haemophilus sputorum]RDF07008.1 DUF1176 domain-containing protein [Haemophilus sputorum]RDF11045.1 DUF1176 domain-containing protein [Haemophilus sputorum]
MKKVILLSLLPFTAMAASTSIKGIVETYQNWDLICDNTGTCNMAGYQEEKDGSEHSVSILFTRSAGEQAPVTAQLALLPDELGNKTAEIILNGQSLGAIQNISEEGIAKLSEKQTTELLTALKGNASIEVIFGEFKEKVSDKGAAAAMLKMDEFQQRLNTPSALIRQGQEKHAVLAPQAAQKIEAVSVKKRQTTELKRGEKQFDAVLALLRKRNGTNEDAENYCYELHKDDVWNKQITLYPLTKGKVLAEAICSSSAYNYTNYYAVLDEKLSKVEQVLENQYNYADYDKDTHVLKVGGEFKARGLGDCWHGQEAVWNGKTFIRTEEHTTGSCKGFGGGAWGSLPTFVSELKVK